MPEDAGDGAVPDAGCDATFCDNFDEEPFAAKWDSRRVGTNTMLGIATPSVSPPNALRSKFDNPPSNDDGHAILTKSFPVAAHGFRCDFEMFIVQKPTNLFADVIRMRTKANGLDDYWLSLGITSNGDGTFREDLFQSDGGCACPRSEKGPPTITADRWVHVSLDTDMKKATATFDGVETAIELAGIIPTGPMLLELGLQDYSNFQADVRFDDLVCRLRP